jgi:hypothetical protein
MLLIDCSPNLQLWPKLTCLETGVINGQGPERCSISDPCRPGHRLLSPIYLDLSFLAREQFLLLVNSDFGSVLRVF